MQSDRETCSALLNELLPPCASILQREPPREENVYLVLNALAIAAASIITGYRTDILGQYFSQMLVHNMNVLRAERGEHLH